MKVVLYLRYSGQDEKDESTLALQEQDLREFCANSNWTVVGVYKDPKHSRFTMNRPALLKMLADAEKGLFERILVYDQSRFSGNIEHSRQLRRELAVRGIEVIGIHDIPQDTPEGKFASEIRLLAEELIKKTEAAKSVATKQMLWQNGYWVSPAPYGYLFNKKAHLLEPDPATAENVAKIFRKAKQEAISAIAKEFGLPWSTVKHILTNPVYIGQVCYRQDWRAGIHEPLVSIFLFESVQERFRSQPA